MKKVYVIIALIFCFTLYSCNKKQISNDYLLSKEGPYYVLVRITSDNEKYEILSEYNGLPVKEINLRLYNNSNIKTLVIPNTIEKIDFDINYETGSLENIYYNGTPDEWCNVKIVNSPMKCAKTIYMLDKNKEYFKVKEIELSNTITEIGECQFYGFNELINIKIPASVDNIDLSSFRECVNLENIDVDKSNKNYASVEGVLYDKSMTELIKYPSSKKQKEFAIMEGIIRICDYAFEYSRYLENVVFSSALKEIGGMAFMESGLKEVNILYDIEQLGELAFQGCEQLEKVNIRAKIASSWGNIFMNIPSIKEFIITPNVWKNDSEGSPYLDENLKVDNFYYLGAMEDWLNDDAIRFLKCEKRNFYLLDDEQNTYILKNVSVDDPELKGYVFWGIGSLESIKIGKNVENISSKIIGKNENLTTIEVDKDNLIYDSRNSCNAIIKSDTNTLIAGCGNSIIPNDIVTIDSEAFADCINLEKLIIPKNIKLFKNKAFYGCLNLKEVYYEGTLMDWCKMFNEMEQLSSNPMSYTEKIYMLDDENEYYELKDIVIPEEITELNYNIFCGYDNVENVYLHKNIKSIKARCFENCDNLKNVYFNGSIEDWCNIDISYISSPMVSAENFYYLKDNEYILATNIIVPGTIKKVNEYQFGGFDCLKSITFEDGVEEINYDSLENNPNLIKIVLPPSLKSISLYDFDYSEVVIYYTGKEMPEKLKEMLVGFTIIEGYHE